MLIKKGFNINTHKPIGVFVIAFLTYFFMIFAWSLATPLTASPDEPVQVAKAAAVVRGQFVGHLVGGSLNPNGVIEIPEAYADLGYLTSCFQGHPAVPASCAHLHKTTDATISETIYNARYLPLYYAIVGLPTFLNQSTLGLYAMRCVSALLSALFLALAITAVIRWSRNKFLLVGLAIATTPSALFFAGVVNPAGLETAAAICFCTTLFLLVSEQAKHPPKALIAFISLSAATELLTWAISPLWVLIALLAALIMLKRERLTILLHDKRIKVSIILVGLSGILGTIWTLTLHATDVLALGFPVSQSTGNWEILALTFRRSTLYYKEIISFFGALNVPSPMIIYIVWAILLSLLYLVALIYGSHRQRIMLAFLLVAVVGVPVVIAASQARRLGIVWQGSDALPLFVSIPLASAAVLSSSPSASANVVRHLSVPAVASVIGASIVIAFYAELRRYAVGTDRPIFSIFHSAWHPPLGIADLLVAEVLVTMLFMALFIWASKLLKPYNEVQA